jgi:hypothetical protein
MNARTSQVMLLASVAPVMGGRSCWIASREPGGAPQRVYSLLPSTCITAQPDQMAQTETTTHPCNIVRISLLRTAHHVSPSRYETRS